MMDIEIHIHERLKQERNKEKKVIRSFCYGITICIITVMVVLSFISGL